MSVVNEIEQMQESKDFSINSNITDKLTAWLCPPGFSWALTFDSIDKRKQAFKLAKESTEILNMRIRREAIARDMAQRKMDTSAKGTFAHFKYDIEREYQLLMKFRRALFYTELGPSAADQLQRIKRMEEASVNTGITPSEQMLFKNLMKAKLQAVVDSVSDEKTNKSKNKKTERRQKCNYCNKRHAGGPSKCRKRKADEKARKTATEAVPTAAAAAATNTTVIASPNKRKKAVTITRDKKQDPDP